MIGYASFAPTNQKHNKDEEGMYANLKRQIFNMTQILHDTESTTYLTPTADNHLDVNDKPASITEEKEMQQLHREHFQYKRHLKLQQLKEQLAEEEQQQQLHNKEKEEENEELKQQSKQSQQQQHKRKHHRHHRRHLHYQEPKHTQQESNEEQHQQQDNAKLLQHIAHKLQQEQRQLYLLHQKSQRKDETFNI